MGHGWHPKCTCNPTHVSRSDDRYRQNFPTFNAGTSPALAQRSRTLGLTRSMLAASADVNSGSKLLSPGWRQESCRHGQPSHIFPGPRSRPLLHRDPIPPCLPSSPVISPHSVFTTMANLGLPLQSALRHLAWRRGEMAPARRGCDSTILPGSRCR